MTLLTFVPAFAQNPERDYLSNEYKNKGGAASLDVENWKKNTLDDLYKRITAIPDVEKDTILAAADSALKKEWPSLKLTDFLKYKNEGNIMPYYSSSSDRIVHLTNLVIGELVSGRKGKYMPEIANGLWLILEESTWVSPHHIFLQKAGEGLPDPFEQIIDLRSGDVAAMVAWTKFLLHDELKAISPMLLSKIDFELDNKIISPFLKRDDLHWLGFGPGKVNNWNAWINTNILMTALTAVDDQDKRNEIIAKTIRSIGKFVNKYPEDGGCDEGVTYWGEAGARLIQFVSLLSDASGHKLNWEKNNLIHNMGTYIYKMHIANDQYVNFADANAQNIPSPASVYTFGKVFNDSNLKQFAAFLRQLEDKRSLPPSTKYSDLNTFIKNIQTAAEISKEKPIAPLLNENWLPDLQVLSLRENSGSNKGLFFAAKGGHNAESHNHNDVGNFVLYYNGKPFIIDLGVDTYTKQTFSKDRYTLFNMQSGWHNCPVINGIEQKQGKQYKASNVAFIHNGKDKVFSLDIAGAYPEEANVKSWKRTFQFSPQKNVLRLREDYKLNKYVSPFELHFMTDEKVTIVKDGVLMMGDRSSGIMMEYNPFLFNVELEEKKIEPGRLAQVWGDSVTRITLKSKLSKLEGSFDVNFKPGK